VNAEVNWPNSAILTRPSASEPSIAVPDIAQARIKIISFLEHDPPGKNVAQLNVDKWHVQV